MKKQEELVVITKTYDLILWSCNHTSRFPRQHCFVLGERLERRLYEAMISFASLLKYAEDENPADIQLKAQQAFPKRVAHSALSLRKPTSRVPQAGKHVILGIATYSKPELELLDDVDKSLGCDQSIRVKVAVFDVANCEEMKDFSRYIPGIDGVYQTPVGAIFSDGKLAGHATEMSDVRDRLRRFSVLVGSSTVATI